MKYKSAIIHFMESMNIDTWYIIDDLCKKNPTQMFVDMVKTVMQETWFKFGWKFEFNKDYTKLRKICTNDKNFEQWLNIQKKK